MDRKELLKRYFAQDGYVKLLGIEIAELTEDRAVVRLNVGQEHLNGNGTVQGGMLYTVADFAFALLANYLHPITVTQVGQVTYLKASSAKAIVATATETVRVGKNTVSEVMVCDEQGEVLCICHFNGFIKEVSWDDFEEKIVGKVEV